MGKFLYRSDPKTKISNIIADISILSIPANATFSTLITFFACCSKVQCKDELKNCVASASGFVNKGKCFVEFAKCLKNGGPSSPSTFLMDEVVPDRHPYVVMILCYISMLQYL